jgi:N-acetyl-anhydromuramyl-L-alanine amidase AmpD
MAFDVKKLIQVNLTEEQYFKVETPKKMIFLHHTAGNASAINTARFWQQDSAKIATSFIIAGAVKPSPNGEKDGDIIQCFGSKYYAYHLGLKQELFQAMGVPYQSIDKISIGIEICNWGQLTKNEAGSFKNYVGGLVPANEVTELETPFKGFKYFHSYTDAQIQATKDLVTYLCDKFQISKVYNPDIFDLTKRAFMGENGIYSHNAVRRDKVDVYPCPRMIAMLKSL